MSRLSRGMSRGSLKVDKLLLAQFIALLIDDPEYMHGPLCRENGFPTRSDSNQAVQPQKTVRGLKLQI